MSAKGKPFERVGRKAIGLSFDIQNMAAGLPGIRSTFQKLMLRIARSFKNLRGASMIAQPTGYYHGKSSLIRRFLFVAALIIVLLSLPVKGFGADVTLAWDANNESDLLGYIVYWGTAGGSYSHNQNVGNTTQYTISDKLLGDFGCFISTAAAADPNDRDRRSWSLWREIRGRETAIIFAIIFLVYLVKVVLARGKRLDGLNLTRKSDLENI